MVDAVVILRVRHPQFHTVSDRQMYPVIRYFCQAVCKPDRFGWVCTSVEDLYGCCGIWACTMQCRSVDKDYTEVL